MRPTVFRITATGDPLCGRVVWAPVKSIWFNFCALGFVFLAPTQTTLGAVILFLGLTYVTLLLGHSVGAHRYLIHRTYDCHKWMAYALVYLGTIVGMAGPKGLIRVHDIRDWAQRERECHDFFAHRASFWRDAFWQLNCKFEFETPPELTLESNVDKDGFYSFLERTWILQQLPIAAVLYLLGGLPWVVWGVLGRVAVSVAGHWTVTYFTHNPGPGRWRVPDAGVQASNLAGFGLVTMGECWHNNHHAFPESARIGLDDHEFDPGWQVIRLLAHIGLAWNIGMPREESRRKDLTSAA